jgi:lysophospholipid acyltransferase (LPLAT)-like uncharacterized protein
MHKFLTTVFGYVLDVAIRCVCGSNRLTVSNEAIFQRYVDQGNNIFAFWHSRLFFLVYYYVTRAGDRKASILVSMSRDGDYGAALVRRLRQDAVRGSTSRGGQKAIRKLASKLTQGNNVAITPDGPRGPAFTVNEGVIRLAQLTGARIIPVSYDATRKRLLKSWDRFMAVMPFGRVHMAFGEPLEVPRHLSPEMRRHYAEQLTEMLRQLDRLCAERLNLRSLDRSDAVSEPLTGQSETLTPPKEARVR